MYFKIREKRMVSNTYLKHGEEQMLLSVLVLVAIESEHDDLQQAIDLLQRYHPRQVGYVLGGGLEEKEQLPIELERKREGKEGGGRGRGRR